MKKWKDFTREERRMLIIAGVLLIVVLLSLGRIREQFSKGVNFFFSPAEQKEQVGSQ